MTTDPVTGRLDEVMVGRIVAPVALRPFRRQPRTLTFVTGGLGIGECAPQEHQRQFLLQRMARMAEKVDADTQAA